MNDLPVFVVFSIVVCGGLGLVLGNLMREPMWGLLFGVSFGPVGVAYLVVKWAVRRENEVRAEDRRQSDPDGKKCPHCAETIRSEAAICRFCDRKQSAIDSRPRA